MQTNPAPTPTPAAAVSTATSHEGVTPAGYEGIDSDTLAAAGDMGLLEDLGYTQEDETTGTEGSTGEGEEAGNSEEQPETATEAVVEETPETLRARIAELEAQVAGGPAVPAGGGDALLAAGGPLAFAHSEGQLEQLGAVMEKVLDWVEENLDGGILPSRLRARLDGREATDEDEAMELTPQQVKGLKKKAMDLLGKDLPARREELRLSTRVETMVREETPNLFDADKPEGVLAARALKLYPFLKSSPDWALLVRTWVRGYQAEAADKGKPAAAPKAAPATGKPTALNTQGKQVPLAPGAPTGGERPNLRTPNERSIAEAEQRRRSGEASEEDLQLLAAAM